MRIMTGAAMPAGADAVIPVEDTDAPVAQPGAKLPETVKVKRPLKAGDFVRPAGEDFRTGEILISAGTRVRTQEAALLALLGRTRLAVHRKPRVAILSSGDELVSPEESVAPGKIRDTNSVSLTALVESCGAEPVVLGVARDNLQDVIEHLDRGMEEKVDLLLSSAGVSVGAFDYLREAVMSKGDLDFWKVNMRPGKPFAFGHYREIPYIGLPGNPVSSFVGFEVFLRPVLNKMGGVTKWERMPLRARLDEDLTSDGRESYLRCQLVTGTEVPVVHLTGHQGSGNLYSLVEANALLRVPAGVTEISRGSQVEVWPL
jgi:molybdopterin molybdotransferase